MGFQYDPVLSMATISHPCPRSHAFMASRSAVMVPNVRTSVPRGLRKQATTVFLCTSIPQQHRCTISIRHPPFMQHNGVAARQNNDSVFRAHRANDGTPGGARKGPPRSDSGSGS